MAEIISKSIQDAAQDKSVDIILVKGATACTASGSPVWVLTGIEEVLYCAVMCSDTDLLI